MAALTANYSFKLPTVGGDINLWGTYLNENFTSLDALFSGTVGATPNLLTGWKIAGVGVSTTAAQLNALAALTVAEIGYVDGVTSSIQTQLNSKQGINATQMFIDSAVVTMRNADGTEKLAEFIGNDGAYLYFDNVGRLWTTATGATIFGALSVDNVTGAALSDQATAEAGADNTKLMTPLRTKQAIDSQRPAVQRVESAELTLVAQSSHQLVHNFGVHPKKVGAYLVCKVADRGYAVGDRLYVHFGGTFSDTYQMTLGADTTNAWFRIRGGIYVNEKTAAVSAAILLSSWKVIVWAEK